MEYLAIHEIFHKMFNLRAVTVKHFMEYLAIHETASIFGF
jgi:hypothetical protein